VILLTRIMVAVVLILLTAVVVSQIHTSPLFH